MNDRTDRPNGRSGFTIIELLIVMTIIPVITLAIVVPMVEYPRLYAAMEADREMAEQSRVALQWMGRDIRQAAVVLPSVGSYKTTGDTLALAMPGGSVVVWTSKEGALSRINLIDASSIKSADTMVFASPQASFDLHLDNEAPRTSRIRVRINSSRLIMDKNREFSLSGEYGLRRTGQ